MKAVIKCIEYVLPENVVSNVDLAKNSTKWTAEKIKAKTGISSRCIVDENTYASDLAYAAAQKIFKRNICKKNDIDFILFCTQSPDYLLPTSACILQKRLDLSTNCGALDFNLGCSGYVYGLGLAKGLIETGQAKNVLLLTADTYTKHLDQNDMATRSIFGDAGAATLISALDQYSGKYCIGTPVYGTDGAGAPNLILKTKGMKATLNKDNESSYLYMNGPEIFTFTLNRIPKLLEDLFETEKISNSDVDLFVFHQANKYILDHLREKLNIPEDKFMISLEQTGNTVSSSIPIALKAAQTEGKLKQGDVVALVGFGVGYSWGAVAVSPYLE